MTTLLQATGDPPHPHGSFDILGLRSVTAPPDHGFAYISRASHDSRPSCFSPAASTTINQFLQNTATMPETFSYKFDTPGFKGTSTFNTGLFINGKFVDGANKTTIEYVAYLDSR